MNPSTAEPARLLSAKQIAQLVGCSEQTIMRRQASMPKSILVGRLRRWRADEIAAWIGQGGVK
jgi:predicted DNA-binding transcriptional regulator AlpA